MTVNNVSKLTGVSIRTLQYYDKIGLLKPTGYTESGYRLYDDIALERLQQILLYKELKFSLKEIKQIIDSPNFNRLKALQQQIELLTLKKERLEDLINFARKIQTIGVKRVDFKVFDTQKIDEYAQKAKNQWGKTEEYMEFEKKQSELTDENKKSVLYNFMKIFMEFGQMTIYDFSDLKVQNQVEKLQDYITDNFYKCNKDILRSLGQMYVNNEEFRNNIDKFGGKGTANFVSKAIEFYCTK